MHLGLSVVHTCSVRHTLRGVNSPRDVYLVIVDTSEFVSDYSHFNMSTGLLCVLVKY